MGLLSHLLESAYIIGAIQGEECVRREHLGSAREGMADLEEWQDGEGLVELRAQTREYLVGEEDIALDLLCYLIDCAWVAETERISPCLEALICVEDGVEESPCSH